MGAESLKSGFTESLKFLKKSLPHIRTSLPIIAITAQFGETLLGPSALFGETSVLGHCPI